MTIQLVKNHPLTSKQKFCFCLARQARAGPAKTELLFWCQREIRHHLMCHPARDLNLLQTLDLKVLIQSFSLPPRLTSSALSQVTRRPCRSLFVCLSAPIFRLTYLHTALAVESGLLNRNLKLVGFRRNPVTALYTGWPIWSRTSFCWLQIWNCVVLL